MNKQHKKEIKTIVNGLSKDEFMEKFSNKEYSHFSTE